MAFVEIHGVKIALERIRGRAPTLVFLHEGLGSIAQWRDFPREVCALTGCAALVYERRGYGNSDPVALPRPLTFMHDEARELPALLAHERLGEVILIGHSDGASIALLYAAAHASPNLRGVVAIAPHVFVEPICVASIRKMREDFTTTDLRARLARHHGTNVDCAFYGWADAWLDPDFLRWNIEDTLPAIDVPVLVIQGESDPYGTTAQVDRIVRGVARGAHVDTLPPPLLLPGCGHAPHRERPQETRDAIAAFVDRMAHSPT